MLAPPPDEGVFDLSEVVEVVHEIIVSFERPNRFQAFVLS